MRLRQSEEKKTDRRYMRGIRGVPRLVPVSELNRIKKKSSNDHKGIEDSPT